MRLVDRPAFSMASGAGAIAASYALPAAPILVSAALPDVSQDIAASLLMVAWLALGVGFLAILAAMLWRAERVSLLRVMYYAVPWMEIPAALASAMLLVSVAGLFWSLVGLFFVGRGRLGWRMTCLFLAACVPTRNWELLLFVGIPFLASVLGPRAAMRVLQSEPFTAPQPEAEWN